VRIGIDIGGTKTEAVLLGDDGGVVAEARRPAGFGAEAVIATAFGALDDLGRPLEPGDTLGVGIPGAVDSARGRVEHAVNLDVVGLDLGPELAARTGIPVRIENDVNAAALGAFARTGGGPDDSMAYLNLGTGLAAGIVLGGRLWRGARGVAGEIGHIPVDPLGEHCRCGQRGCLEMVASGASVARAWPVEAGFPIRDLLDRAAAGEERAVAVRDRFAAGVADAVRLLVLSVDVERVVIGGGLTRLGDELLALVRGALEAQARGSAFLAAQDLAGRVSLVPHDVPVSAVGAALAGGEEDRWPKW
jgi:glucokinase